MVRRISEYVDEQGNPRYGVRADDGSPPAAGAGPHENGPADGAEKGLAKRPEDSFERLALYLKANRNILAAVTAVAIAIGVFASFERGRPDERLLLGAALVILLAASTWSVKWVRSRRDIRRVILINGWAAAFCILVGTVALLLGSTWSSWWGLPPDRLPHGLTSNLSPLVPMGILFPGFDAALLYVHLIESPTLAGGDRGGEETDRA